MAAAQPAQRHCTPAELTLRVVLAGTLSHYEMKGMVYDKQLEHLLHAGKQILYKSHQESDVRLVCIFTTKRPHIHRNPFNTRFDSTAQLTTSSM